MINVIGLIFNLAGVILLFRYGMPYRVSANGGAYLITESLEPEDERVDRLYARLGKLGLGLIVLGSIVQGVASLMPT